MHCLVMPGYEQVATMLCNVFLVNSMSAIILICRQKQQLSCKVYTVVTWKSTHPQKNANPLCPQPPQPNFLQGYKWSVLNCGVYEEQSWALCVANVARFASYTMFMVTWYHSECYVPSGLDFKAAGGFVVQYLLSNYLLCEDSVTVNVTWAIFHG